jgi:hypothetical protein
MADHQSTIEIETKTTLGPEFERLEKIMLGPQPFVANVAGGASGYKPPPDYEVPPSFGGSAPGSSTTKKLGSGPIKWLA